MTAHNYTSWGLKDCSRETADTAGFGSMLGRLLLRTLPGEYDSDSVYTWFPLQTPVAMKKYLGALGMRNKYRYERPVKGSKVLPVGDYNIVRGVMGDKAFKAPYGDRLAGILPSNPSAKKGFFIASDSAADTQDKVDVRRILVEQPGALDRVAAYFGAKVRELVRTESYYLAGRGTKNVDVAGVVKGLPIWWAVSEVVSVRLSFLFLFFGLVGEEHALIADDCVIVGWIDDQEHG